MYVQNVLTIESGELLPAMIRARLEHCFSCDLSSIRIHQNDCATKINRQLGSLAFAVEENIYIDYDLTRPDGMWLLAHETAHVLQWRNSLTGSADNLPKSYVARLEEEACAAASYACAGRRYSVSHPLACPSVQTFIPLVLILVAAGVMLWPKDLARDDRDFGSVPQPDRLYETPWGFVPVAGSLDQMINGRNLWTQATGAVFFMLDLSVIPGVVRGVFFKLLPSVQRELALAARGAAGEVRTQAFRRVVAGDKALFLSEQHVQQLIQESSLKKTMLFVGAQSGKEGIEHSVVYVLQDGNIHKLHGGLFTFAAKVRPKPVGKVVTAEWLRRFNTLSIYRVGETAGITDNLLRQTVERWNARASGLSGAIGTFPRGCAYSQAVLLEELGIQTPDKSVRYLPLLLERSRIEETLGSHYVVNAERALSGTNFQTRLARIAAGVGYLGARNGANYLASRAGDSIVATPMEAVSFDPEDLAFPDDGQLAADLPSACFPEKMVCE